MVLVQKWLFFQLFFFRQYGPWEWLLRYSGANKRLSRLYKQEVQKVEKLTFFFRGFTHGFRPKMAIFQLFFLGNIGQENDFYDNLEQKNAFLGYRNKKLKKWKNWHFSKGVNPWFRSKKGHFYNCSVFYGNIGRENFSYDILER